MRRARPPRRRECEAYDRLAFLPANVVALTQAPPALVVLHQFKLVTPRGALVDKKV